MPRCRTPGITTRPCSAIRTLTPWDHGE